MKFSLGGSSGNWWSKFAKNFTDSGGEIGKFGKGLTTNLSNTRDYLTRQGGGTIGDALFHQKNPTGRLSKGLANLDRTTMGWSRQLSPIWDGGLTKSGGTFQDIFGTEEEGGMFATILNKTGHHVFGQKREGYGSSGSSGGGGGSSNTVVSSDSEDPSLINAGNWEIPAGIEDRLRREQQVVSNTDLTKNQRGRLNVANVS